MYCQQRFRYTAANKTIVCCDKYQFYCVLSLLYCTGTAVNENIECFDKYSYFLYWY
jgi:hypothetical protein